MLRLAFDFIITWRETRTRPNAYHEGTYYNFSSGRMKDRSFCFSLGFNYYMQGKNFKYRNKKSLQSTEQGIKL